LQLQKSWVERKRVVNVEATSKTPEKVASLPFGDLQLVLPHIDKLLLPLPLSDELQAIRSERPPKVLPPDYVEVAPRRVDFWDFTVDGEQISSYGCVPLMAGATQKQYDAVLEAQIHLRDLKMLHQLDEAEVNKLIQKLRHFQHQSKHGNLVDALIDGLTRQQVNIYKGLGTGFTVPDSTADFWGLSIAHFGSASPRGVIDLFISKRSPSDIGTVLHTWLAHHGVSRVQRYEEELRLERVLAADVDPDLELILPLSIRTDIERSTPAEALFLLQQMQASQVKHPFRFGIEEHCRVILIDEASASSWKDAHSRRFLDGSISMQTLLEQRLVDFVRMGSTQLPSLGNLMQLFHAVEKIMADALFDDDLNKLNLLRDALLQAYDPWNSWTDSSCEYVDVNTDLFALIFFCALRGAALEDIYIEATDHCPFFISQPDQAAVFSELWVLGSQCELYFCMLPRDLGEIIYAKYRSFLNANPPPEGKWGGKNLMTVYSKPEPSTSTGLEMDADGPARRGFNMQKTVQHARKLFLEFGALSIFCLPAIIDIILLTFVGRGLFMTAFMDNAHLEAAILALLISLLLSSGVTGWVGSVGNYYLCNVSVLSPAALTPISWCLANGDGSTPTII
jgi:hypothetical protein